MNQHDILSSDSFEDNDELKQKIDHSFSVIQKALDEYGPECLAISFNGGKDCTVLLFLLHFFQQKRLQSKKEAQTHSHRFVEGIKTVYFLLPNTFEKVTEFTFEMAKSYNLELITIRKSYKEGLEELVRQKPSIKAIFMGQRRSDPHGAKLDYFTPTTPGWPALMRVNPVLDWSYQNIWAFIRKFKVPYCPLYDEGYTSIGHVSDTKPNPELLTSSGTYIPAFHLQDEDKERGGRIDKKHDHHAQGTST